MTKASELNEFLIRCDELIESKYILADVKIVNLLKSIAASETLIALFKSCLTDFDYASAKKKYLVKNKYLSEEKGEFVLPSNSRDLLALVFNILMEIDSKTLDFADFINKYFYENGSFYAGYSAFINAMIKPFKNSVKTLMESVIEGKLQDPLEAVFEEEKRLEQKKQEELALIERQKSNSNSKYVESVKKIKDILLSDKKKIKESKLSDSEKNDILLIIDMLANVISSNDNDAIAYAFVGYKYVAKVHKLLFYKRITTIEELLNSITKG